MRLVEVLRDCWNHNSLPKVGIDYNKYVEIKPFRFYYWYSSGCYTEEIKVVIVHPDGSELKIIHKLYGENPPDWDCWKTGAWDQGLKDAMTTIAIANHKQLNEMQKAKELASQNKAAKELETRKKFEALFHA